MITQKINTKEKGNKGMSKRLFVGVIDSGDYRVAQLCCSYCDEPETTATSLLNFLREYSDDLYARLPNCKFTLTEDDYEDDIDDPIEVLESIVGCDRYETIDLMDNRDFATDAECDYGFVINYDTRKFCSYMRGMKFLVSEYDLDELPLVQQYIKDYKAYSLEHIEETREDWLAHNAIHEREMAVFRGQDPDEAEAWFRKTFSKVKIGIFDSTKK